MATLIYSDVDGVDRSFALGNDPVMVGRAPECAIRSQDPRVSRLHARFYVESGTLWVEDLGSSNGIFVGPNKVQRAPVPTGEIILVGSVLIRLLPASGTLPPPMGLHGTLASWLDLERKTRSAVEEERDAFAKRVGELHQQIAAITVLPTLPPESGPVVDAEAVRLRDEAEARAAALERALAAVQDEVMTLRRQGAIQPPTSAELDASTTLEPLGELGELRAQVRSLEAELADRADWSTALDVESSKLVKEVARLQTALDEAEGSRSIGEHATAEAAREARELRAELDEVRRASQAELELVRLELAKAREGHLVADASVGIAAAEKLAEADRAVSAMQARIRDLETAQLAPDARSERLAEQITTLTARAEKLDKDLAAAQIRAQGAERNLSGANASAAKAETRAAQLEQSLHDAEERIRSSEHDVARALERVAALETRVGAGDAPLQAAEQRSAAIASELAEMTSQFETRRDRLIELERGVTAAQEASTAAEARTAQARAEAEDLAVQLAAASHRSTELEARLAELATAERAIAAASQQRDEATAKAEAATQRAAQAERRAEEVETRASAADTMAKAMAKDVAEALRRAAEADKVAKSMHRDVAESARRAVEAEARLADGSTAVVAASQQVAEADARASAIQRELTAKLEATQRELTSKLDAAQRELSEKLEATQRELAAERSGLIALVDRKTQLERELAEARSQLQALGARASEAERKLTEAEAQLETLHERLTDAESGVAVSETAARASLDEAREQVRGLEARLAELSTTAARGDEVTTRLVERVAELERQLRETTVARELAEAALVDARAQITGLEQERDERVGASEALAARADAGDLALGRAAALQRQLDEALSKLSWLEQEASTAKGRDGQAGARAAAELADRVAAAEARVAAAEARASAADAQLVAARDSAAHAPRVAELESQVVDLEGQVAAADGQLREMTAQLTVLQKEVDAAENVRSFAAETEREIAQFQRDLRDARAKLTQMTLDRDRLASELKQADGDEDTTNRAPATFAAKGGRSSDDHEITAQVDLRKYESMIAQSTDLQDKVNRFEREEAALRQRLAETEQRLRDVLDRDPADSEATRTGSQLPIVLAEHVSVLEESIDSLRSNMRAASDETAMMEPSDSVVAVSSAVSAAAEHIERARSAIKALAAAIGMNA